jgi:hypothetical protein
MWWLSIVLVGCTGGGSSPEASEPLSELERSMIGVWSGFIVDETTAYTVFTEDRRGCTWDREGDDFGRRFDELQFEGWWLDEEDVDEDGRMIVHYDGLDGGDHFDLDRYDEASDTLFAAGISDFALGWRDILIRCEDSGTESVADDQVRQGSQASGGTGGPGSTGGPGGPGGP